jgi:glutathionyl-hydroquinone reductase
MIQKGQDHAVIPPFQLRQFLLDILCHYKHRILDFHSLCSMDDWISCLITDRDAQYKNWRFGTKEISSRGSVIQTPSLFHLSYELRLKSICTLNITLLNTKCSVCVLGNIWKKKC